jgi:hypothetical protein
MKAEQKPCLEILQDLVHFPRYIREGMTSTIRYGVMELLRPSLSPLRNVLPDRKFPRATTIRLTLNMVWCIEACHFHVYVHPDIKLVNFLLRAE